ncbi:MAG: hypothetical protein KC733_05015, partial [Candidatus Omnitrophica bacterium]|nr:hypothetical protein [Candidatus Omnitrophota bacterium]
MKKIHVIIQKKDELSAMEELRRFGAVHVDHQDELKNREIFELREDITIYNRVLHILKSTKGSSAQKQSENLEARASLILDRLAKSDELKETMAARANLIKQWDSWGDFDPADIEYLKEKGVYIYLCEIPHNDKNQIVNGAVLHVIS